MWSPWVSRLLPRPPVPATSPRSRRGTQVAHTHIHPTHTPLTHITLTPFPPTGGAAGSVAGENEEEEEETEEVDPIWGPLKEPVNIKLADLGNACWVVST